MKQQDNLKTFIEAFDESNSEIASDFENELRERFLRKSSKKVLPTFIFSLLNMRLKNAGYFLAIMSTALLALVAYSALVPQALDSEGILQKANAENSILLFNNDVLSDTTQNSYVYISRNIKPGNKFDECYLIRNFPKYAGKYETHRFYSQNHNVLPLTKNVGYGFNNEVVDYYLYDGTNAINYMGGDYAIQINSESNDSYEVATSASQNEKINTFEDNIVSNYFPNNAKLSESEDYYIAELTNEVKCNEEASKATVITQSYLNKDTLKIEKNEFYLKNVSLENLIYGSELEFDARLVDEQEVKTIFQYDLDAEIKQASDITLPSDNKSYEELKSVISELRGNAVDYLVDNPELALAISSFDIYATNVSGRSMNTFPTVSADLTYMLDRNFYLADERGDDLFNQAVRDNSNLFIIPELRYTYQIELPDYGKGLDMNVYKSPVNLDSAVKTLLYNAYRTEQTVSVEIDSVRYDAQVYKRDILALNNPSTVIDAIYAITFEYSGHTFVLSGLDASQLEVVGFQSADIANRSDAENFAFQGFNREL